MLKLYRRVFTAGAVALGLAACGDDVTVQQPPPPPTPGVTSVTVAPDNVTISINQEVVFAAAVVADAGVATTVSWTTNNSAIATVDGTGKVKGIAPGTTTIVATSTADPNKRGVATVTVAGNPPGIISFGVTPLIATLAPGQFVQAAAQIVTAFGVATPAVTWTSSNPAIATVNNTTSPGLITGVAAGSTIVTASITVGSQTTSATIGVTVRALTAATVSIKSITTGLTTLPVNVSNVFGQIEVTLNFNPGEQTVDSVTVFLGAKRAAKQSFITNPAAGDLVFSINTANFVKNFAAGTTTVDYLNGSTTVSAAQYPRGATGTATQATAIVLNNSDGWAADMTAPTAFALSAAGVTYWGGPAAAGVTSATLYPVIYTPGRSITTVTWTLGPGGAAACGLVTQTVLPFKQTFGYVAGGAQTSCVGYESLGGGAGVRDNVVVTNALDNTSTPYPLVNAVTPLIADAVVLAACVPVAAGCVAGSTPDSLRLDYKSPVVGTPSIVRVVPAVTGWVNAIFNFINFDAGGGTDAGVGLRAVRDRAVTYSSNVGLCPSGVASVNVAMPTGTGADIPECSLLINSTTTAYRVSGSESDRLSNVGTSGASATFGVDKTNPNIRWGLVHAAPALAKAYGAELADAATADSAFGASTAGAYAAKPVLGTNVFRAEYLDDRAGFFNAGQPLGGVSAQVHQLSWANHVANTGGCGALPLFGTGPVGAAFVTNPSCGLVSIAAAQGTLNAFVRLDGWQPGITVNIPTAEAYYGYKTCVFDAAGNGSGSAAATPQTCVPLLRRVLVNANPPFSTGLGIPAVLTASTFNFLATASDSAEVSHQSLQVVYPNAPVVDSLRYARVTLALNLQPGCAVAIVATAYMDDCISSPFAGNIQPRFGNGVPFVALASQTPYSRGIEIVDATVFPGSNTTAAASFPTAKPTKVLVWAWNWGGGGLPSPFPGQPGNVAPTASPEIAIPALNVENGASILAFNTANPLIAINHWRVITTVGATNQFGSTVTLRAQAASPTNAPNPPFTRVDFYRLMDGPATISAGVAPTHWNYLGSVPGNVLSCVGIGVCNSDQGTYRSWVYQLPNASFVNGWNTSAIQGAVAATNRIVAVGVVSTGDAISTLSTIMIP